MPTPAGGGVLNPAELHRECVALEHQKKLLQNKLVAKDEELAASWDEIKKLVRQRDQYRDGMRKAEKESIENAHQVQTLISERNEWRSLEVELKRALADARNRDGHAILVAENHELQAKCEKLLSSLQSKDDHIKEHIATRGRNDQRKLNLHLVSSSTQTDLDTDTQKLIEAESVACVGMNEAKHMKVELQQLKRKVVRLETSNSRANEACVAYRTGCEAMQEEIEHLTKELSHRRTEWHEEKNQLLADLRQSEQQERTLHLSIEKIRQRDMSVEEARQEVEKLCGREQQNLRNDNQTLREEVKRMELAVTESRNQIEEHQKKYLALMKILQQAREQADDHRKEASEEILALNKENSLVFTDYCNVVKERTQLRETVSQLEGRMSNHMELAAEHRSLMQRLQSAEQQLSNISPPRPQTNIVQVPQPVSPDMQLVDRYNAQRKEAESEIQSLKERVAELESLLRDKDGESKKDSLSPVKPKDPTDDEKSDQPTRLQALLSSVEMSPERNVSTPQGMHAVHQQQASANEELHMRLQQMQSTLMIWGRCAQRLVQKLTALCNAAQAVHTYQSQHLNPDEGVQQLPPVPPVNSQKYPTPWSQIFQLVAVTKRNIAALNECGMVIVSRNVVLHRKVTQMLSGPEPVEHKVHGQGELATPSSNRHIQDTRNISAIGSQSTPLPDSGIYENVDHTADTDSDDSLLPGEDLGICTDLIQDTDTLLRAAQGAEAFWGDARIEKLKNDLNSIQREPIEVNTPSTVAYFGDTIPVTRHSEPPQREIPPSSFSSVPTATTSGMRTTMRWS
eukprot:TRINITY_DN5401_c0_g2_i1.p1 TRINITY_DN5401_c0_g2~~TRINITY_DN5401_c0_g2_i1.p1  ORF type:complete len:810 (+),score=195.19 TRINITY_DN5401_c0_g2_i1:38-2431(+)